jgi:hypothetical protein
VDPADDLGAGPARLIAAIHQQPQGDRRVVDLDLTQAGAAQPRHGHAVRVDRVGLACLPGVEHPHPRRQLGRHVHDGFAVGDQALGDVAADPGAALHRPHPVREPAAGREHRLVATSVGAVPALREYLLPLVDDLDRGRPLVRIHPDHHTAHPLHLLARVLWTTIGEEGNATWSWAYPS